MKAQFNHRNYRNNVKRNSNNGRMNVSTLLMCMAFSAISFGVVSYSFLRNLVIEGCNPFERLNRGQMRQMWFLRCMYHC